MSWDTSTFIFSSLLYPVHVDMDLLVLFPEAALSLPAALVEDSCDSCTANGISSVCSSAVQCPCFFNWTLHSVKPYISSMAARRGDSCRTPHCWQSGFDLPRPVLQETHIETSANYRYLNIHSASSKRRNQWSNPLKKLFEPSLLSSEERQCATRGFIPK